MEDELEVQEDLCGNGTLTPNCTGDEVWVEQGLHDSRPEKVLVPILLAIIFVTGLISNISLAMFLTRRKRLKSPHYMFVASLTVSDLIMLIIGMPLVSTLFTLDDWPFGAFGCKLSEFAQTLAASGAILNLVALSVDRFISVVSYKQHGESHLALVVVFGVWITSGLFALPEMISSTTLSFGDLEFCVVYPESFDKTYSKAHVASKFVLLFMLPLATIATFYALMAERLLTYKPFYPTESAAQLMSQPGRAAEKTLLKRRRIALAVLGLVLAFIVCWLPRHIFLMWFHFDPADYNLFWHWFKIVGFCLMFTNSAINPIIYGVLDDKFMRFVKDSIGGRNGQSGLDATVSSSVEGNQTVALTIISPSESDEI